MEEIHHQWQNSTPRRISLSGLGGVGKTELSISIVEKFGPMRYVLYLRAGDENLFQQDLATAAQDLRNELLRFESGDNRAIGEDPGASAFYFSAVALTDLVSILKRWLKATPYDGSRILVVLDDLDGLEASHHQEYSPMFSGDALDLIYTTRDPSMADLGMLWPAVRFDVQPLQVDEAVDVLEHFSKDNHAAREQSKQSSVQRASGLEHGVTRAEMRDVVTRLGALPAAITIGSHYVKDNIGSKWNPDSYRKFLDSWDQGGGKSSILKSRRAMLRYRHSMLASFELSLHRLRRNVKDIAWHDKLENHCLMLLQLLSAMGLHEISENDLSAFKGALDSAWHDLRGGLREAEFKDVTAESRRFDHEISINECITELVKVSLLTERSSDGTLLLNSVTQACALLVPNHISSDEMAVLRSNAEEIGKHWNRSDPNAVDDHA